MKKVLLVTAVLFIVATKGFSQIEKGTFLLGGTGNISLGENSTILLNPSTGLFLSDKFCAGVGGVLYYNSQYWYWGLGTFGRYYFSPKQQRSFFVNGSIDISHFFNSEYTIKQLRAVTLGVGHVWMLNKSIGFETDIDAQTSFHDVVVGLNFGFQIYFNKSKE